MTVFVVMKKVKHTTFQYKSSVLSRDRIYDQKGEIETIQVNFTFLEAGTLVPGVQILN